MSDSYVDADYSEIEKRVLEHYTPEQVDVAHKRGLYWIDEYYNFPKKRVSKFRRRRDRRNWICR